MSQKQKEVDGGGPKAQPGAVKVGDNEAAKAKAKEAKDLLAKMEQDRKKEPPRRGCCGCC